MGSAVCDQQLGCLWQGDHILSVSLSGYINYLDKNNPNKPLRSIKVSVSSESGRKPLVKYCSSDPVGTNTKPLGVLGLLKECH